MRGVLSEKPPQLQVYGVIAQWQTSSPGQKWAAGLVVSRVRAAGIEEDEKDMRKRVTSGATRCGRGGRSLSRLEAKRLWLVVGVWAQGASRRQGKEAHGGVVDGTASRVVKTLTAAVLPPDAPLPRPPLTEKELCWMNAADKKQSDADKKRKRQVKKRRGKKLTVAESEAESESERGGGGGSESSTTFDSIAQPPKYSIFCIVTPITWNACTDAAPAWDNWCSQSQSNCEDSCEAGVWCSTPIAGLGRKRAKSKMLLL
eukprot:jgi/Tetstr1/441699/TSEL_029923.t1